MSGTYEKYIQLKALLKEEGEDFLWKYPEEAEWMNSIREQFPKWSEPEPKRFKTRREAEEYLQKCSQPIEKTIDDLVVALIPKGEVFHYDSTEIKYSRHKGYHAVGSGESYFYIRWSSPNVHIWKRQG